jgi:hypothetical protein
MMIDMKIQRDLLYINSDVDISTLSLFGMKMYSSVEADLTLCGYSLGNFAPQFLSLNTKSVEIRKGNNHYHDLEGKEVSSEYVVRDIFLNDGRLLFEVRGYHIVIRRGTLVVIGARAPHLECLRHIQFKDDIFSHFGSCAEVEDCYDEEGELYSMIFYYKNGLRVNLNCLQNKVDSVVVGKREDVEWICPVGGAR